MDIWQYTQLAILVIYILLVATTVYTVLYELRDPVRAMSWIAVVIMLPGIGLLLFIFFGQNFRKRKIFNRKELRDLRQIDILSQRQIRTLDEVALAEVVAHKDIVQLLLANSKTVLTTENTLTVLENGDNTFKAIIDALKSATDTIHLEYYIIEADNLGNQIADILCEKARAGLEVRLLYDDVGSWSLPRKFRGRLKDAGVEMVKFMPVVFPWFTSKANYRNHRKIIVIDGIVGFTGGLNIADRYIHGATTGKNKGVWRDTHLKIEGEAVRMLQITFITDWYFSSHKFLQAREKYFPPYIPSNTAGVAIQIAISGPDSDYASIMQGFFAAIARAKRYIYISTPYFLPGEALLTALKVAAMSGVDVRIMLPEKSDALMVHWASRSYFTELMEAKIGVYLYQKGFNHSKLMIIDGTFSSVGSANMDARSFEDNFEVTAMIYNAKVAQQLEGSFLEDLLHCKRLTLRGWQGRKQKDNFKEAAARLFSPLL